MLGDWLGKWVSGRVLLPKPELICPTCKLPPRDGKLRGYGSMTPVICQDCFSAWYDGCNSTDPEVIGEYSREVCRKEPLL